MTTETRIAGLRELLDELNKLPIELGKKVIWSALGGGAKPVKDRAAALAPVLDGDDPSARAGRRKPGTIRKAIRVSRSKINKGQRGLYEVIVRVKPLKSKQKKAFKATTGLKGALNPDDPYYWWFVEFGTSKMPAKPFLRPAFSTTKTEQLQRMRVRMDAGLKLQARKIAQRVNNASRRTTP